MEDLSLHILDIAENSIDAGADRIEINIKDSVVSNTVILTITDNGGGMDAATLEKVTDPFFSTKTVRKKRFGLGIPLLSQACEESGGGMSIDSAPGKGTMITAGFRRSHIDRKPLGDMGATMMTLIGGHPEINFVLTVEHDKDSYRLDTEELRQELDGAPLNLPEVLRLVKDDVNEAFKEA
jgi:hypothetical protein